MPPPSTQDFTRLRQEVTHLRQMLQRLEEQRARLTRRRRRRLLVFGIGISVTAHLCLMIWLALQLRTLPGGGDHQPVSYEIAILPEEELTQMERPELEELLTEPSEREELPEDDPSADLDPVVSAPELQPAGAGSLPTLGGSGEGSGSGRLSGGASASFFGVSSRGMRFAFIVDRSGSMQESRKLQIALEELRRSIEGLPDYAEFFVVLYSSNFVEPPMQSGWTKARRSTIGQLIRWLNIVDPSGGTVPAPAFQRVFSLPVQPDVIFFLTDGQIPEDTAVIVREMNGRGGRVIVNTIAFGDNGSQELLRRMARDAGGVYRYVPVGGE